MLLDEIFKNEEIIKLFKHTSYKKKHRNVIIFLVFKYSLLTLYVMNIKWNIMFFVTGFLNDILIFFFIKQTLFCYEIYCSIQLVYFDDWVVFIGSFSWRSRKRSSLTISSRNILLHILFIAVFTSSLGKRENFPFPNTESHCWPLRKHVH